MIELSTQTILVMNAVGIVTSAIALTFLWLANRDIEATAYWALSPWFLLINFSLFALQKELPQFLGYVISNWSGQFALILIVFGMYKATTGKIPTVIAATYFSVFAMLQLNFTYIFPSFEGRILLITAYTFMTCLWVLYVLIVHSNNRYSVASKLVFIGVLVLLIAAFVRGVNSSSPGNIGAVQDQSTVMQWFMISVLISQQLFNFGFAIMVGQMRLEKTEEAKLQLVEMNLHLEEAKVKAEEGSKHKSEFLANMSHEIRTPMNGVIGMLSLLAKEPLAEQQKNYVTIAQSSAQSLLTLINDILDFSKIEAGKLELEETAFSLDKQIAEIIKPFAYKVDATCVELVVDSSGLKHCSVIGDPLRFKQVLSNLISNAVKFTKAGEIVITLNTEQVGDDIELLCSVEDTGIGISKLEQKRLFSSFNQVDASTTREYGGSGLGLAIVQKLCALMGGQVTLSSEKHVGSTFSFNLRFKCGRTVRNDGEVTSVGKSILLVESNDRAAESVVNMIQRQGFSVIGVNTLDDAERKLSSSKFDMVFVSRYLSNVMTDKWVEQMSSTYPCQFIIVGRVHDIETKEHFQKTGCFEYLQKPLTQLDFVKLYKICNHLYPPQNTQLESAADSFRFDYPYHLLLVEDNAINQVVACKLLANLGLKVSVAKNGLEAILFLSSYNNNADPIYLVLMDCQMPEMDGFEATRRIRAGEGGESAKRLPIIALTANAMKGDQEACLAAGMTNYLAKPIQIEELISVLANHLPENRPITPLRKASDN